MSRYIDKIAIDKTSTTLETFDAILERIREIGNANPATDNSSIEFEVDAEDPWDLRDLLSGLEDELSAHSIYWAPTKEGLVNGS